MKYFSHLLFVFLSPDSRVSKKRYVGKVSSHGFMLIELIIATLIASMIGTLLLTVLYQSNQMQAAVDDMIDVSERIGIVSNVLEKDLAGAFVPTQAQEKENSPKQTAQPETNDKKTDTAKNQSDQNNPQKKEPKPIEKIFYSTNKNGMLDTLTFVTNNPLVVFVGKDVGVVKPKVVRVQYTIKPDAENKNSYSLFRQESNELDLAEYKNVRPYEIIGGIKKITATFTARIEKKPKEKEEQPGATEKKANASQQKKEYEYKTQPEWVSEQKKEANKESEKKESEFPRIPYSVEFKITIWDKQQQKEQEFTLVCSIPVDSTQAEVSDEKKSIPPVKETQKPKNSADKTQQPGQQNAMNVVTGTSSEVVVYNGIEVLNNALDSLKKLLGHG